MRLEHFRSDVNSTKFSKSMMQILEMPCEKRSDDHCRTLSKLLVEAEVKFFNQFSMSSRMTLSKWLLPKTSTKGERIIRENDPIDAFYIIFSGTVHIYKRGVDQEEELVRFESAESMRTHAHA